MKVTLTSDDGAERDITEDFRLIWDTVTSSMDWGSGFLDLEEYLKILHVGLLAEFKIDALLPDAYSLLPPRPWSPIPESPEEYQKRKADFEAYVRTQLAKYDQVDPTNPEDVG